MKITLRKTKRKIRKNIKKKNRENRENPKNIATRINSINIEGKYNSKIFGTLITKRLQVTNIIINTTPAIFITLRLYF